LAFFGLAIVIVHLALARFVAKIKLPHSNTQHAHTPRPRQGLIAGCRVGHLPVLLFGFEVAIAIAIWGLGQYKGNGGTGKLCSLSLSYSDSGVLWFLYFGAFSLFLSFLVFLPRVFCLLDNGRGECPAHIQFKTLS
jgi:hypothetical protein